MLAALCRRLGTLIPNRSALPSPPGRLAAQHCCPCACVSCNVTHGSAVKAWIAAVNAAAQQHTPSSPSCSSTGCNSALQSASPNNCSDCYMSWLPNVVKQFYCGSTQSNTGTCSPNHHGKATSGWDEQVQPSAAEGLTPGLAACRCWAAAAASLAMQLCRGRLGPAPTLPAATPLPNCPPSKPLLQLNQTAAARRQRWSQRHCCRRLPLRPPHRCRRLGCAVSPGWPPPCWPAASPAGGRQWTLWQCWPAPARRPHTSRGRER